MKWISGGLESLISLLSQPVLATVVYDSMEGGGVWMSYKMWVIFQKKNYCSTWTTKYFKKYWTPPLRTTVVLIKGAYFVDLTCYKCWCNPKKCLTRLPLCVLQVLVT